MASKRKPVKSANAQHPLLHAFRTAFPECLGNRMVSPPPFPVELEGLPIEQWPVIKQSTEVDLIPWPDIWRLIASGHPETVKIPGLLPNQKNPETYEMVHVLLTLAAVMGGHTALFKRHYEAAENVWRYEYGFVMLGGEGYAPKGLAKALMRHAFMAALTYGRKDWAKSFWKQLGNQAFTVSPEPGFVRREEWLFGKGGQHIFGHPEAMNHLIQIHWSKHYFSTINSEGWYVGSPLEGQVTHGRSTFSPDMLDSLLERTKKVWKTANPKALDQKRAELKEMEDVWEAAIKVGQWETFEMLRPWVRPDTLNHTFLKACQKGDLFLCQKLLPDRPPAILGVALNQMAEQPPAEALARPILDLLLAHVSPRSSGALQQASKAGTAWLVDALLPHADASEGQSLALRLAVEHGHWAIAERLWTTSHHPTDETRVIRTLLATPVDQINEALIQQVKAIDPIQVANALISNAQVSEENLRWATHSDRNPHWSLALAMLPFLAPEGQKRLVTQAISTLLRIKYLPMLLAFIEQVTDPDQIKDWQQQWGPEIEQPIPPAITAAFRACEAHHQEAPTLLMRRKRARS